MLATFLRNCFAESNVHGFPFIVNTNITPIERCFWIGTIIVSITFASFICANQWDRYENNPIVLSMETNYRNWYLRRPAVTICGHVYNTSIGVNFIWQTWRIGVSDKRFRYYERFLKTIAFSSSRNLSGFAEFNGDPSLQDLDVREIALQLQGELLNTRHPFQLVVTELGICHSSTLTAAFELPTHLVPVATCGVDCTTLIEYVDDTIELNRRLNQSKPEDFLCSANEPCRMDVTPGKKEPLPLSMYFHSETDIMHAGKNRVDLLSMWSVVEIQLKIGWMIASDQINEMSLHRRKCRFYDEPIGPHFEGYTRTICETECRISAALEACGCAPFFYNVASDVRQCSVSEYKCLADTNWVSAQCLCPEECESITFTLVRKFEFEPMEIYDRRVSVTVELPKNRYRRGVVFSMDSLIVSLGGAAALFLGCSFISVAEFVFFFAEFCVNCANYLMPYRNTNKI